MAATYNLLAGVRDSTSDLPFSVFDGNTKWVTILSVSSELSLVNAGAYLVKDSDGGIRLAKVDT